MINKKVFIVTGLAIGVLLVISLMFGKNETSNPQTTKVLDEDTGEVLITDENVTPEKVGAGVLALVNGDEIYPYLSSYQFNEVKQSISDYVYANIENADDIRFLKVLKDTTSFDETYITSTIKSDNPEFTFKIRVEPSGARLVKIKYYDASIKELPVFTTNFLPQEFTDYGRDELGE